MKLRKLVIVFGLVVVLAALLIPMVYAQGPVSHQSDSAVSNQPATSNRLIVELASQPMAVWSRETKQGRTEAGKLNLQEANVQSYMSQLEAEQNAFIASLQSAVPGAAVSQFINETGASEEARYRVVFNGMAIDPGSMDRDQARDVIRNLAGVKAVYLDYSHYPHLYTSTELINAPALWDSAAIGGQANGGAGIKVASMDGGLHKDAPMFSGDGFSYPPGFPPNGLGLTSNNNGKIIASRAYFRAWDPPAAGDQNPWPGENGTSHGVHTGGIAVGNIVDAPYLNLNFPGMSGVAPGAWAMSYRVFYASVSDNPSFYTTEGLAALEDIVADGADVLNNSWGEGPTSLGGEFDPLDMALINASEAGVFISLSAGNAGPGGGTTDHPSDDYIIVAASTTSGTLAAGRLDISAPAPISPTLQNIAFAVAGFGSSLPLGQVFTYSYVASADISGGVNLQGCDSWAPGTFTGKTALIKRGTCDFSQKVYLAQQGGAEFVVIYNHEAGGESLISMSPGISASLVTVPSVFIGNTDGTNAAIWHSIHGNASELTLSTLAFQAGNTADRIIDFSSRGPGAGDVLKPDIAAPGVNILSQGYAPGTTGEARHLGFGQVSGTSMASPHVAGAAALLRQIHPDWSNAYIKSALMSTSKYQDVYNYDDTPAQPLDMGAGRLDLTNAADPGVILDPPSVSFGVVADGTTKTIQVKVTSVAGQPETYNLSLLFTGGGFPGSNSLPGFSVSPSSISLAPGASANVSITFNAAASGGIGDHQGYIILDGPTHDAHMPTWARVTAAQPVADVLVIDNDGSASLGHPNYSAYYTSTLDALGYSYNVIDADALAGTAETFLPEPAVLYGYRAIIYYTGDNFQPDGTFAVPTPLTEVDTNRLTEYANNGGLIIAMGQDLAAVLDVAETDPSSAVFFYNNVLGANWLQDSVTGGITPTLPIQPLDDAPPAFDDIVVDVGAGGDGAANQLWIDEIQPHPPILDVGDPNMPEELAPYVGLLKYPGLDNVENGVVATAHRDQPTLEAPGVGYRGRSIYTTFGLEGVNNLPDYTSRAELLQHFFAWGWDEPEVIIIDNTPVNGSHLTTFTVEVTSSVVSTTGIPIEGISYRWDFGDGTIVGPFNTSDASHQYALCGQYTVTVEATDSFGNKTIGTLEVNVNENCDAHVNYLPLISKP